MTQKKTKALTNKGTEEVAACAAGLISNGDEEGRVADAGVVLHEGVVLQVNAGGCRAVPHTASTHSCDKHTMNPHVSMT